MKKLLPVIILLLCTTLLLVNIAKTENEKVDKYVYSELEKKAEVPVIIDVKEDYGFFEKDNIKEVKKIINGGHSEQGDLILASVSENEIARLEESGAVDRIEYSPKFVASLQDSAGIVNATRVWSLQQNSLNLTGAGETVCIIDTGINFSHADLIGKNKTCVIDCYDKPCIENCSVSDDSGHGTHVAGIVAASSGINGIAQGSGLIGLKVLNSGGGSSERGSLDIENAIEWCVANRNAYNISVISMSLGTTNLYSDYCDTSFDSTLTKAINNATYYNISVVAASGNSGNGIPRNTTSISSPACISNVSAVSATNKDDSIASYAHYSSLVKLMAPGTSINSTWLSGYKQDSGTSMAAPHVAAGIAIIKQFLQLTGQTKTPKEIEAILNNTGKIIYSNTGLNFSRINIYDSLNEVSFNSVSLILPVNNLYTRQNQTFSCNVSSNVGLNNLTFLVYNASSLIYNETRNISGFQNSSNFSYNFTYEDNYNWNCLAYNNLSFQKLTGNFSVTYDLTAPILTIVSPINNSWYNSGKFNLSINENGSCWYSLNQGKDNVSMSFVDNRNFNATNSSLLQDQTYNVSFYCNDSAGNLNSSSLIYFKIDLIKPNVSLVEPFPADETSDSASKIFYYNASDNFNLSRCDLVVNNAVVAENSTAITNSTNNISYSFSPGTYNWKINCTDLAGNIGNSSSMSFVINAPIIQQQSSGGGGGGGSSTSQTYILSSNQISSGYTNSLAKNDKIKFTIFDEKSEEHSITVDSITSNSASLIIASNPVKVTLGVGQSIKLNLTSPNYYNLYIKLEEIASNKAKLTIQTIHDPILLTEIARNETITTNKTGGGLDTGKIKIASYSYATLYTLVLLSVLIAGYFILRRFRKQIKVKFELKIGK